MRARLISFIASTTFALALHAQVPPYVGQHESTEADTQAILKVTTDFRAAVKRKSAIRVAFSSFAASMERLTIIP